MKKYLILIFMIFSLSISQADYSIDFLWLSNIFWNKLVGIHFLGWWNDFWWFLFVTWKKNILDEDVKAGSETISTCQQKLRWYYFNPMHWDVLYPLDNETKQTWVNIDSANYSGLDLDGWFYTTCTDHLQSVYGMIKYKVNWKDKFSIYAGFEWDYTWNSIKLNFKDNLQFIQRNDKENLVWLMYDSMFWLVFVWWRVDSWFNYVVEGLNNTWVDNYITTIENTRINTIDGDLVYITPLYGIWYLTKLVIKWLANIESPGTNNILLSYKRFTKTRWTIYTDSPLLNIWKIKSRARKNAYRMCMWKWNNVSDYYIDNNDEWKTICIKDDYKTLEITKDITINNSVTNIVMLWENNKVKIDTSQVWSGYINIFVDKWFVVFGTWNSALVSIDKKWEWADSGWWTTSWFIFNGNIIVNGLIWWADNVNDIWNYEHKLFIKWSLLSLNTIWINTARKEYVEKLFWVNYTNYVNLQDVFKWECIWLTGSDGSSCGDTGDVYNSQSLVIKKTHYENPILK